MNNALIGSCAVGIVIVDGPAGTSAAFTSDEMAIIRLEVSHGFDILYDLSKLSPVNSHLLFVAEVRQVKLDLDPSVVPAPTGLAKASEYAPREQPWRDRALSQMGFGSGRPGVAAYTQTLLSKSWPVGITPSSAYAAFFTKYNTAWMAYADTSRRWLVMQFAWIGDTTGGFAGTGKRGPGTEQIDQVFAHESCHIFGAPDEYFGSGCSPTGHFGELSVVNGNCQTFAGAPALDCLMSNPPKLTLCNFTLGHLGLVDADGDGVLDASP